MASKPQTTSGVAKVDQEYVGKLLSGLEICLKHSDLDTAKDEINVVFDAINNATDGEHLVSAGGGGR